MRHIAPGQSDVSRADADLNTTLLGGWCETGRLGGLCRGYGRHVGFQFCGGEWAVDVFGLRRVLR